MSFRSVASTVVEATGLVIAKPSGVADGDVLLAFLVSDDTTSVVTWPSGWDPLPGSPITTTTDSQRFFGAIKRASSEPANWTFNSTGPVIGAVLAFSGRHASLYCHRTSWANQNTSDPSPWDIIAAAFSGGATSQIADLIIAGGSDNSTGATITYTPPSGFTQRVSIQDTTDGLSAIGVATRDDAPAGQSGAVTMVGTSAGNATGWAAFAIALMYGDPLTDTFQNDTFQDDAFQDPGASEVTGDASVTFGALTPAATGTVDVAGAAAVTMPAIVPSAAGLVEDPSTTGDAAITLPALQPAAAGSVDITGAAAITLPALTPSAAGTIPIDGAAAITLPALAPSSAGTVAITGDAAIALPPLQAAADGTIPITGAAAITLPALQPSAAGIVGNVPADADAAVTMPLLQPSATGTVTVDGAATVTLPLLSISAAGVVTVLGDVQVALPSLNVVAEGDVPIIAAAAIALPSLTVVGSGVLGELVSRHVFGASHSRPRWSGGSSTGSRYSGPATRGARVTGSGDTDPLYDGPAHVGSVSGESD